MCNHCHWTLSPLTSSKEASDEACIANNALLVGIMKINVNGTIEMVVAAARAFIDHGNPAVCFLLATKVYMAEVQIERVGMILWP